MVVPIPIQVQGSSTTPWQAAGASSGEIVDAETATRMTTNIGPAENGIRSPLAPRWAPNVMVASTTYPSTMEK